MQEYQLVAGLSNASESRRFEGFLGGVSERFGDLADGRSSLPDFGLPKQNDS
jgi:hypothetical protein